MKQFKTESKRILDLMANSIYTNTDIFLRELVSNASDAIDKRNFLALTDEKIGRVDGQINLAFDKEARTITISDNGLGMSEDELENNLGTIARSGSLEFKENNKDNPDLDIIGQFGVGFYSAFMVADKIEVLSKKAGEEVAHRWLGTMEGYELSEAQKEESGTTITLFIKENSKEKKYSHYLDSYEITNLIKRYSDFITYPIKMLVTETRYNEDKSEEITELKTLNSMTPIWKKNKKDLKPEDYDNFYSQTFFDYNKPLKTLHYKVEGNTSYTALLYIPKKRPYDFYSADYKYGLSLYSKGVFIKDEAKELVSDYFRFIRGVIDSDDLNLNISREILQEDYQMTTLKKSIDKKIKSTLEKMLEKERADYEEFFDSFGQQLKYGAYDKYGANKDVLIDLLLFKSSKEDKYVTLKEYVANMKEDQKEIYYATGESIEQIKELPQIEKLLDKGYEVLYFLDNVDEFMTMIINEYDKKPFKSVLKGDLDLDSEAEKDELKKTNEDHKDLIEAIKEDLKGKVMDVKFSNRLKSHPVCLVSDDNLSIDMEKTLNELHQNEAGIKANKILELNPDHELIKALEQKFLIEKDVKEYAQLLYDQAMLIAGLPIADPIAYTKRINNLMLKAMR